MSPPPTVEDFVPAITSGSGNRRRSAARAEKFAASISLRKAVRSPRLDSARSINAPSAGRSTPGRNLSDGDNAGRINRLTESGNHRPRRARSVAASRDPRRRRAPRSARNRSKPAVARRRASTDVRQLVQAIARRRQVRSRAATRQAERTPIPVRRARRIVSSARFEAASTRPSRLNL